MDSFPIVSSVGFWNFPFTRGSGNQIPSPTPFQEHMTSFSTPALYTHKDEKALLHSLQFAQLCWRTIQKQNDCVCFYIKSHSCIPCYLCRPENLNQNNNNIITSARKVALLRGSSRGSESIMAPQGFNWFRAECTFASNSLFYQIKNSETIQPHS